MLIYCIQKQLCRKLKKGKQLAALYMPINGYIIYIQIRYNKFQCKHKDNKEKQETIAAWLASKFLINRKCVIVEKNLTGLQSIWSFNFAMKKNEESCIEMLISLKVIYMDGIF